MRIVEVGQALSDLLHNDIMDLSVVERASLIEKQGRASLGKEKTADAGDASANRGGNSLRKLKKHKLLPCKSHFSA